MKDTNCGPVYFLQKARPDSKGCQIQDPKTNRVLTERLVFTIFTYAIAANFRFTASDATSDTTTTEVQSDALGEATRPKRCLMKTIRSIASTIVDLRPIVCCSSIQKARQTSNITSVISSLFEQPNAYAQPPTQIYEVQGPS